VIRIAALLFIAASLACSSSAPPPDDDDSQYFFDVHVTLSTRSGAAATYSINIRNDLLASIEVTSVSLRPVSFAPVAGIPVAGHWMLEPGQQATMSCELRSTGEAFVPFDELYVDVTYMREGKSEHRTYRSFVDSGQRR
jgi:hypothetical protein